MSVDFDTSVKLTVYTTIAAVAAAPTAAEVAQKIVNEMGSNLHLRRFWGRLTMFAGMSHC